MNQKISLLIAKHFSVYYEVCKHQADKFGGQASFTPLAYKTHVLICTK